MKLRKLHAGIGGYVLAAILAGLLVMPAAASAAPSSWWQIVTGSRPTHLWEPEDNVQEINVSAGTFEGQPATAAKVLVDGKAVGCLGAEDAKESSKKICLHYGFPLSETAAQLQAALEPALGADIEVTGGPATVEPFEVRVPGRTAPSIGFLQENPYTGAGKFTTKVLSEGGSGRLTIIAANIGDAPMDATGKPLKIADELPEGIEAIEAEGIGGGVLPGVAPVNCEIKAADLVSCSFGGALQPFDSIEVEIAARLTGQPPVQGAPGKVTVSGGTAPAKSVVQEVEVSPDPVPFGIAHFSSRVEEEGGAAATRAGGHPFQFTTALQFTAGRMRAAQDRNQRSVEQPAQPRNMRFPLPAGLLGNVTTVPTCSFSDFSREAKETTNGCPDNTAIGAASVSFFLAGAIGFARPAVPVFNLPPAVGEPARLGFTIANQPQIIDTQVDPNN